MSTRLLAIVFFAGVLHGAFAGEKADLSAESLRVNFSKARKLLNSQSALNSISSERVMKTEFGTPTHRGVELKSADLTLTMDPATGQILSIEKKAETENSSLPTINTNQAENIARSLVRQLGLKIDSGMRLINRGFDSSTGRWGIAWEKQIDGYPFPEETVFVLFNDRDRSIAIFRDRTTDLKCSTKPIIEENTARMSAEHCVNYLLPEMFGEHYEIGGITQGKLQVVYPNRRYVSQDGLEGTGLQEAELQPRLVYSFDLTFRYTGTSSLRISTAPIAIWVDALTGNVIGGL